MVKKLFASVIALGLLSAVPAMAAPHHKEAEPVDKSPEAEYYKLIKLPIPDDVILECGGLEWLPDGKLAVGTRRGDIYIVENVLQDPPTDIKFTKWATGLHEILGLAYNKKDGYLYACQRPEVTRLKDTDNRGHTRG